LREVGLFRQRAQRIDADHASAFIEQRTSAVAGVYGGGVLDESGAPQHLAVRHEAGHRPDGVGRVEDDVCQHSARDEVGAPRIADGGHLRRRLRVVVREHDGLAEEIGGSFDDRQILDGVGGDETRGNGGRLAGREERDVDRLGAFDHVVVGSDRSLVVDDEAGALVGLDLDADNTLADPILIERGGRRPPGYQTAPNPTSVAASRKIRTPRAIRRMRPPLTTLKARQCQS
jgi:hypothetical protein